MRIMLREDLENLYSRQSTLSLSSFSAALDQRGNGRRIESLNDAAALSLRAVQGVFPKFGTSAADTGSWIANVPLPLQLLTQPHLTVDLTLAELNDRPDRPFGISLNSLVRLADQGHIFINLRDYDSDGINSDLGGHLKHERFLSELLSRVPQQIYFGSAVRKPMFDAISGSAYEQFFYAAKEELSRHAVNVPFRKVSELPEATFWHWAYLNACAPLLPEGTTHLMETAYRRILDSNDVDVSRNAFGQFARTLRLLHLNFTAPLTASFGTTYNMKYEEQVDSMCVLMKPGYPIDITNGIDSEEQAFLAYLFADGLGKTTTELSRLCGSTFALRDDVSEFADDAIQGLIRVLADSQEQLGKAHALLRDMWGVYLEDGEVAGLASLISDYQAVRTAASTIAEKEKSLERILRTTAGAGASAAGGTALLTHSPWIVALLALHPGAAAAVGVGVFIAGIAGAEAAQRGATKTASYVVPRALLRPKRYRMLHRVHKLVAATKR